MDNYYYLLLTNNPDKYYEYYWLSFKQSIYDKSSTYIKKEFDTYSNNLNKLQKEKKFDDILLCIEEFLSCNIVQIIAEVYLSNIFDLRLLKTNIHRFMKFKPTFILKNIEYDILIVIANMINRENYDKIDLIHNYIRKYFKNCIDFNKYQISCITFNQYTELQQNLYQIVNLCIEHNIVSLIDICSQYIDITLFYKDNVDTQKVKLIKGIKLMKLLEQKSIKSLVK